MDKELTITRLFNAPRTVVWKFWTDPKYLVQWWGPRGFTNPLCRINLKSGGSIYIDMRGADGTIYPMKGKFIDIAEPKLLVFTSFTHNKSPEPFFVATNIVTLADQNEKTLLVLHARATSAVREAEPYLNGMNEGWSQSLDRLEALILKEKENIKIPAPFIEFWKNWAPRFQSLLRIVAAITFFTAGTTKLIAFPGGIPPNGGTVPFLTEAWIAGILETFGGALLIFGLFTRPVAFILSGEMAVAYFQFHFPQNPWPTINMGVPALLYCFIWLFYSAAGAGAWSLDALRNSKSHRLIDS